MFIEMLKIIIGFVLTGVLGVFISSRYQRKNSLIQIKILKVEKDVLKLKEVVNTLEVLSSVRNYKGRCLADLVCNSRIVDMNSDIIMQARNDYKDSVAEWNKNINKLYIELYSLGMYEYAIRLEREVHDNFRIAHSLLRSRINDAKNVEALVIGSAFSTVFKHTRSLSYDIVKKADEKWDAVMNGNFIPLRQYNLEDASSWLLIKALFNKRPDSLSIRRSVSD